MTPGTEAVNRMHGPLQRLHTYVGENKIGLMEFGRIGGNMMLTVGEGMIKGLPVACKVSGCCRRERSPPSTRSSPDSP
ncbi:hypothetical protein SF23_07410 [Streptomyces sp. MBRL 10]|nr:hypothetical protein SF23_07410 [Streptomyces sp. MBRL 10]